MGRRTDRRVRGHLEGCCNSPNMRNKWSLVKHRRKDGEEATDPSTGTCGIPPEMTYFKLVVTQ